MAKEAREEGETRKERGVVGRMGGRDQKKVEEDYELFLRDLEEDPEMRGAVNLYKVEKGQDIKWLGLGLEQGSPVGSQGRRHSSRWTLMSMRRRIETRNRWRDKGRR